MQIVAKKNRFFNLRSSRLGWLDRNIPVSSIDLFESIVKNPLSSIVNSQSLFSEFTNKLAYIAENFCYLRDWNSLEEISQILRNLPLSQAQQLGLFYQAIVLKRKGQRDKAQKQYEEIAYDIPFAYRARVLQALGLIQREQGQIDDALKFQIEGLRIASSEWGNNPTVVLMTNLEIGSIKSLNGDHQQALEDIERDWPLIRFVARQNPFYYYVSRADLAYELGQVGRIAEAEAAINIALASPFAQAYPEWSETRDEIEQKRNYPDLSHCFIEHALTKSETVPDSVANTSVEVDTALQLERATELKTVRVSSLRVNQSIYQRPSITSDSAISLGGFAQSILQRLDKSIQPRGPPAFHYFHF